MNLSLKSLLPSRDLGWNRVRARCGQRDCYNTLLTRALPQSRSGIHVGDNWYCSPDCFAIGITSVLAGLARYRMEAMPRNPRLSIGLAMISKGFLSAKQLHFAANLSRDCGENVETVLRQYGLATEKQIAAARAVQWGYPVVLRDLADQVVNANLPRTILAECSAVPLHVSESAKRIVVGFVERVDHECLQSIEHMTGCRPDPCFITRTEFEGISHQMTASSEYREVAADHCYTADQMAKALGGIAVKAGAREAVLTRCNSSVWARLSGKRELIDVIFSLRGARHDSAATPRERETYFAEVAARV